MKIKGMDGNEHNVASQGQSNLNTVLGAVGTAGVLFGGNNGCGCNGGGLFGNLFGGNGRNGNNCCVDQQELWYATELAACRGREFALNTARQEDAALFAESRRTDDKIAGVLKETNQGLVAVANGVSRNDVRLACLEEKVQWIREESARNLKEAKDYADHRVDCEAQLRKAGDDNLAAWTQAELNKKVDGTLKINGDEIAWNRCRPILEACPCGSEANPYNVTVTIQQAVQQAVAAALSQIKPAK